MADTTASIINPPHDKRGTVSSIAIGDAAVFAAGGVSSGMLLVSSNGRDFHPRGDFDGGLRSVHVADGRLFLCGQYGFLAYSDDEGETFTTLEHDGQGCLYSFAEVDGSLLVSADGGVLHRIELANLEVSRVETGASDRLLRVVSTQHGLFLLDAGGELRRAPSLKEPFEVVHRGSAPLTQLTETASGALLLSGDRGQLLRSTDGGSSFSALEHDVHEDIEGVGAFGAEVLAWGGGGLLLRSSDDGVTFATVELPGDAEHQTLWSARALEGAILLGGDHGLIVGLGSLPESWTARDDRFLPNYPLEAIFEGGPDDFIGVRLRAYVAQVNGFDPESQPEPREEEEEEEEEDEQDDGRELEGEDAWKRDAIARTQGLWSGDSDDFQAVWGVEPPPELRAFEAAIAHANPWSTFNELRLDCAQMAAPADDETNLFEQLILNDQLNYLGTALPEAFSGLAGIGSLGNGDTYHLGVPEMSDEPGSKIVFFDHEEHCFSDEFADSFDSLAFLCALTHADDNDNDAISPAAARAGYEALRGRVNPSWHFSIDDRDADFEPYETEDRLHRFCFWRARWLITLFRHDHGGDPVDVGESFIADLNPAIDDDTARKRLEFARKIAPTAIYSAWRAYIFEEPHLDAYLEACRNHASRIARDAGRLIEELRGGRKVLGRILDWPAKLAAIRALDLDPRRAEAREEEARARKTALDARRSELTAVMESLEGEALEVFCREQARDPSVRTSLLASVLERPELAEAKRAATFLYDEDYSRDGCLYRDEEYGACRYLADHANKALQLLLVGELVAPSEHDDDEKPFPVFGFAEIEQMVIRWQHTGTLHSESVGLIRGALDNDDTDKRWRVSSFASLLARTGDAASADVLARRIEATPAEGGFETRLHHDDAGRDLATALGKLGAKEHAAVLVNLAKSETLSHAPPAAALALARLDPTLANDVLLDRLLDRTTRFNNHEDTARALLAYGIMASHRPAEHHPRLLEALESCESMGARYPDVKTARAYATGVLSREGSADAVVQELRNTITYAGYEPMTSHRFVLEFLHDCPGFARDVADALPTLLDTEDVVFRDDILTLLHNLEIEHEPPKAPLSWLAVEGMSVESAIAALDDPSVPGRQHLARRLANENTPAVREALERAMSEVIDRAPAQPNEDLRDSDSRLLKEITLAFAAHDHVPVALYDRALRHPNRDVKDPVLRDPPPEPELADAMRVVAAEKWGWQESTARTWLSENG